MSIKLPQYSIQECGKKPSFFSKILPLLLLFLGLILGFFSFKMYSENALSGALDRIELLQLSHEEAEQKINALTIENSQLQAENLIKNEAIKQLQIDYTSQIERQNQLESEINFYQQLLSPNLENQGLRVFDCSISASGTEGYRLNLSLVQKIQKASIISGRYEIYLIGKQLEATQSLAISHADDSHYEFKYFQKISLGFSVPEGFKPEQLVVKLFPQIKNAKTIEYTQDWGSLTQLMQ